MLDRVLRVLEFPKIIEQLQEHASSSLGKEKVLQLQPTFSFDEVKQAQQATYEGATVLRLKGYVPMGGIRDIGASIKRSLIGGMLNTSELIDIANTIHGGRELKSFLEAIIEEHSLPILERWTEQISTLKSIEQAIKSCIDDHGEVLDSASSTLRTVRAQIRTAEQRIRSTLDQMIKSPTKQKMLQESIITIRNDRFCLSVKQEYRASFGGIVHDQSASGATLFIEPGAVVNINNTLREARLKEEREIEKILRQLTEQVAEVAEPLQLNVEALAELDFIFAKAHYAKRIRGVHPKLNNNGYFLLKKARHPLIPEQEIVPVSFELGQDYSSLIITGPNTGGKTVTLKTLGLLTLMTCAGLSVPAEEETEIAVVSSVYADIGDEQSIEQSLSTFSSHMSNIVKILDQFDHQSLILFDELGAGTDPTEGAALAMAILDYVYSVRARVVATTHYSELKAYAYNKEGVMNASVEFDVQTLRPTYRLLVGVPGRSNAFAIAQRLGLSSEIIDRAKQEIGEDDTKVEGMIASLEENQKRAEQEREAAEQLRQEMEQLKSELAKKEARWEQEQDKRLAQAELKAKQYVENAMAEAEQVIEELKELAKEQQGIKEHQFIEARKKLEKLSEESTQREKRQAQVKKKVTQKFKPGDEVHVHSFGQKGHILEQLSDREYQVQLGIMKMKIDRDNMELIKKEPTVTRAPRATVNKSDRVTKLELDLRGQTIDEAILSIDKYLDDALYAGYQQVSIIHGKGTGQLRKGVQDFLRKHRRVKQTRLGGAGEGGSGVTVVELS